MLLHFTKSRSNSWRTSPYGKPLFELGATGVQNPHGGVAGAFTGREQQARLADAGGALDHQQSARPGGGLVDGRANDLQLGLALYELLRGGDSHGAIVSRWVQGQVQGAHPVAMPTRRSRIAGMNLRKRLA